VTLILLRFQNDPRPLAHFQAASWIDEQRLLERGPADFVVFDPRQDLVRCAVDLDDLESFVHEGMEQNGTKSQGAGKFGFPWLSTRAARAQKEYTARIVLRLTM